jgi:hypothetical protein
VGNAALATARAEAAAPELDAAQVRNACADHKQSLRAEYCDPDDASASCAADQFACSLAADFDGDGSAETVAVVAAGDSITLAVTLAGGQEFLVASGERPLVLGEDGETVDSFGWLLHWEVLTRESGGFFRNIAGSRHRLPIEGADGDALLVSGGDAAAAVFLRKGVFVGEPLGF